MKEYNFIYMGQEVKTGSKMIFSGEFFDLNGNRYYKSYWLCEFRCIQDDKYYIKVGGKLCWCRNFKKMIERLVVLNGKKIPDPVTENEVKSGAILLVLIMVVTTIFKGNVGLWIVELVCYFNWAYHKKYDYIEKERKL